MSKLPFECIRFTDGTSLGMSDDSIDIKFNQWSLRQRIDNKPFEVISSHHTVSDNLIILIVIIKWL